LRTEVTPGPTSTTMPAPSWPRIAGNKPSGSAPERVNSSVWQMPVALISTSTSPALGPVQVHRDDFQRLAGGDKSAGYGGRVTKYKHRFCNTEFGSLKFSKQELGIICVLLLRGPQTPGELRSRTNRLCEFSDAEEVETTLQGLMTREDGPFIARLERAARHARIALCAPVQRHDRIRRRSRSDSRSPRAPRRRGGGCGVHERARRAPRGTRREAAPRARRDQIRAAAAGHRRAFKKQPDSRLCRVP
jgi:hypothetical protein